MMPIKTLSTFLAAFSFFCLQACLALFFDNISLRREIRVLETSRSIANDQISELAYTVDSLRSEKESIATKQFIAGVVEALNSEKRDYLSELWHDGYNRGSSVISYTKQIEDSK